MPPQTATRPLIITEAGLVVAGHHKAAEAGAEMLRRGGNAMDAAVAAAATLAVTIPHMNGLGGDAIALWFDALSGRVTAINGSGAAPRAATPEAFRARGCDRVPIRGALSISIPGMVHALSASLDRFGTRSLAEVLQPALDLARSGIFVDRNLAEFLASELYGGLADEYPALATRFGPREARRVGDRIRQPGLAETLEVLARDGAGSLYGGALGERLIGDLHADGALLSLEDLVEHETSFQAPLDVKFGGASLFVAPPNTAGIALALLAGLDEERGPYRNPDAYLDFLAIKNLAFELRDRYAVDPRRTPLPDDLLASASLARLAATATDYSPRRADRPAGGDTSTLVVVDAAGNAVSWAQSLFEEFGSCIISPSTGIVLHNRLCLQSLEASSRRRLVPGERPFHTLCPALLVRARRCELAIATPGDHGQPQTIYQVLRNVADREMDLQQAIEAPRVRHDAGDCFMAEDGVADERLAAVKQAGYVIRRVGTFARVMGGVNAIGTSPDGIRMGAADPRRASYAVAAG